MAQQVLAEKIGLVFGVANKRSIAWAIAKAWAAAGARLIFNYQGERLKENVEELIGEFGEKTPLFPCDVSSDDEIKAFFESVRNETDHVDLMLHSMAYAPREALEGVGSRREGSDPGTDDRAGEAPPQTGSQCATRVEEVREEYGEF